MYPRTQAECEDIGPESFPGKACVCFGIDPYNTIKTFCKPRIKVGTEWVTKGQTCGEELKSDVPFETQRSSASFDD